MEAIYDMMHCYFWERKLAATGLGAGVCAGLTCGMWFAGKYELALCLIVGIIVGIFFGVAIYAVLAESFCKNPCRDEDVSSTLLRFFPCKPQIIFMVAICFNHSVNPVHPIGRRAVV